MKGRKKGNGLGLWWACLGGKKWGKKEKEKENKRERKKRRKKKRK